MSAVTHSVLSGMPQIASSASQVAKKSIPVMASQLQGSAVKSKVGSSYHLPNARTVAKYSAGLLLTGLLAHSRLKMGIGYGLTDAFGNMKTTLLKRFASNSSKALVPVRGLAVKKGFEGFLPNLREFCFSGSWKHPGLFWNKMTFKTDCVHNVQTGIGQCTTIIKREVPYILKPWVHSPRLGFGLSPWFRSSAYISPVKQFIRQHAGKVRSVRQQATQSKTGTILIDLVGWLAKPGNAS